MIFPRLLCDISKMGCGDLLIVSMHDDINSHLSGSALLIRMMMSHGASDDDWK
jgi:hypothetical protein